MAETPQNGEERAGGKVEPAGVSSMLSPHSHVIRQPTGACSPLAGVGRYMTATWPTGAVCGSVPIWQEMHEMA